MAALFFINRLVEGYGTDPKITRILDEQIVYVVPRLNPDGAELALAAKPSFIRSGTRPYPSTEKQDGLHEEDIDGDGRILQMRIADPTGDWKVSDRDPRLMVKRGPDEEGGQYYRLFDEGLIENYDGHMIKPAPGPSGSRLQPQLPRRVAARGRAARRGRLSGFRAGDPRRGRLHGEASQRLRCAHLPHLQPRHPAPLRHEDRRRDGHARTSGCSRPSASAARS